MKHPVYMEEVFMRQQKIIVHSKFNKMNKNVLLEKKENKQPNINTGVKLTLDTFQLYTRKYAES